MARKNLRKIPAHILEAVKAFPSDDLVAGFARTYSRKELEEGVLNHLGVIVGSAGIEVPKSIVPEASRGKFSLRNRDGYVVIRRDLPKEPNIQPHDVPSWGSRSSTHTVNLPHPKYPRDHVAPTLHELEMAWSNKDSGSDQILISFRVNETISRKQPDFDTRLLANLNLLQENVGGAGIEGAEVALADFAKTLNVSWEILPPGTREEAIERIFPGNSGTREERNSVAERYDFFKSMGADRTVKGLSGFRRYFGALLPSGIALFENVHYGNAVYIFFSGWERMSQLSRIELLTGRYGIDFARVEHRVGWQDAIRRVVAKAEKNLG